MIRVVSWNMDGHNRHGRDRTWRVLQETGVDVALLQDAAEPLPGVADGIELGETAWERPIRKRPPLIAKLSDRVQIEWFSPVRIEETTAGVRNANHSQVAVSDPLTIAAARIVPQGGEPFIAVSMYGRWLAPHPLAASVSNTHADASIHRILSDLSAFTAAANPAEHRVLAAGDLNLSLWTKFGRRRKNVRVQAVWDRFAALGFEFLGPQQPNGRASVRGPGTRIYRDTQRVITRRARRQGQVRSESQIDYVFASRGFHESIRCRALNEDEEWGPSDHCRILIEVE